jgi:tRNA threonylcarbamoyladenosine biosynthesis protein TsaB
MNLLAIETATEVCSIAYFNNSECVKLIENQIPQKHAETLPLYFDEIENQYSDLLENLDGIAVSIGPGSFTGLRIGLSYAKGLAFSHQLPIVPIPTLRSLAGDLNSNSDNLLVWLKSHKNIYFEQRFKVGEQILEEGKIEVKKFGGSFVGVFPNDSVVHWGCDEFLEKVELSNEIIRVMPSAKRIGKLAIKEFEVRAEKRPYNLVPSYISPFKIGSEN